MNNKIHEEILKQTLNNFNFRSRNVFERTKNKLENIDFQKENLANDYHSLIKNMKQSFYLKSLDQKKYFHFNISQKINRNTNERIVDLNNENILLEFQRDIEYTVNQNNELVVNWDREIIAGDFLTKKNRTANNKRLAKVQYLEEYSDNRKKYFLTWTLPSEFHKYRQRDNLSKEERHYEDFKALELNPNYGFNRNFEKGIIEGLEVINNIHRFFYNGLLNRIKRRKKRAKKLIPLLSKRYNDLKAQTREIEDSKELSLNIKKRRKTLHKIIVNKRILKKSELDFIRIIEPHKSLTPHQHVMVWLNGDLEAQIKNSITATIKRFDLNEKFQDLEIVKSAKASTYIAKYLIKNMKVSNGENEDESLDNDEQTFYDIYRQYFGRKTKFFTSSNYKTKGLTQKKIDFMYKYIKENKPNLIKRIKKTKRPLYIVLEKLYQKGYFRFEEETRNHEEIATFDIKTAEELPQDLVLEIEKTLSKDNPIYIKEIEESLKEKKFLEIKKICSLKHKKEFYAIKNITQKPFYKLNNKAIEDKYNELKDEIFDEVIKSVERKKKTAKDIKREVFKDVQKFKRNGINDKKFLRQYFYSRVNKLLEYHGIKEIPNKREMFEDIDTRIKDELLSDINQNIDKKGNPYLEYSKSKIITKVQVIKSGNEYIDIYNEDQYINAEVDLDYLDYQYVQRNALNVDFDYLKRYYKNTHVENIKDYDKIMNIDPKRYEKINARFEQIEKNINPKINALFE